jgi:hypothetical protein
MDAGEQDLAARPRMGAHQRPPDRRQRGLLLLGVIGVAQQEARMKRVVLGLQPLDLAASSPPAGRHRRPEIGELGVAAAEGTCTAASME